MISLRRRAGEDPGHLVELVGAERAADDRAERAGAAADGERRLRERAAGSRRGAGRPRRARGATAASPGGSSSSSRLVRRIEPMSIERTQATPSRRRADGDLRRAAADVADGDQPRSARARAGERAEEREPALLLRPRAAAPAHPPRRREPREQLAAVRRLAARARDEHLEPLDAVLARVGDERARRSAAVSASFVRRDRARALDRLAEPEHRLLAVDLRRRSCETWSRTVFEPTSMTPTGTAP